MPAKKEIEKTQHVYPSLTVQLLLQLEVLFERIRPRQNALQ